MSAAGREIKEAVRKRSFEDVYRDYYDYLNKYIYKRIGEKETAESLSSDIFFRAFKNYDRYDPEKASEKTWLFCIANNLLKNYYRDRKITDPLEDYENSPDLAYEDDMERAVYYQECRDSLAKALDRLSDRYREIIIMKYFQDKNTAEIAGALDMKQGNVRICMMRALNRLSDLLEADGFTWEG